MAEGAKKISFGFSKLKKQSTLVKVVEDNKPDIEYVDSFDGVNKKFSYKGNVRCDEPVKKELVIPLIGTKSALEVIKLRLEEKKLKNGKNNSDDNCTELDPGIKDKEKPDLAGKENNESKNLPEENKPLSIDDLAAKEILSDLQSSLGTEKLSKTLIIKQSNKISKTLEETDIDYENIPVNDFGLAMLRGMGWTPETGIGKEQRVVQIVAPKLRPKGLGLGADKVMMKHALQDPDLTISIKSYVKFVSGAYKGNYGQVEAMDEDTGRVTVKLAFGGMVSVSEVLLIPVTKKDYEKNSKVINPMKYETFKDKAGSNSETKYKSEVECKSSESGSKEDKNNRHRKEKYDRRGERDQDTKPKEEGSDFDDRRGYSSSDSSTLRSPQRSKHKKSKKMTRAESRDRKHKKSKKKRKKNKYKSDYDTDDSDEKDRKRETSRNRSRPSKTKYK